MPPRKNVLVTGAYGLVEAQEPPPALPFGMFAWCSQRDIAQIAELCANAPESLRFDIFQGALGQCLQSR